MTRADYKNVLLSIYSTICQTIIIEISTLFSNFALDFRKVVGHIYSRAFLKLFLCNQILAKFDNGLRRVATTLTLRLYTIRKVGFYISFKRGRLLLIQSVGNARSLIVG